MMNCKLFGRKRYLPNFKYYHSSILEGLTNTTENLSEDSRSLDRDLNSGLSKYESGVLTTRPRRSVQNYVTLNEMESDYEL
jgi:hypothetical protein